MILSIIVPWYKSKETIFDLFQRLTNVCRSMPLEKYELLFIEDCGNDGSWELIENLACEDPCVKGIQFSRNFGQHCAITAGLDLCCGDWVVVMDCDLQDRPEEIPALYAKATEGYDVVFARRKNRQDYFFKKVTSRIFNCFFNFIAGNNKDPEVANFSMISKKVVDALRLMRERGRAYGGHVRWLGFKTGFVDVEHQERAKGGSSYTFCKLLRLAVDTIVTFSNKPLRLSVQIGFFIAFLSFICAIWVLLRKIIWGIPVSGWASLMISIWFIGGLLFFNLGIIGLYLGKVFDETKHRPLYIISKRANL